MITIISPSRYRVAKKELQLYAVDIMRRLAIPKEYGVNIVFVGTRKMSKLGQTYKNSRITHPVLSFNYMENHSAQQPPETAGEVIICYPQAILLATDRDKTINTVLKYLIEHGIKNLVK